ncbi:ABC transporter substrate-binding protein [Nocardia macrotermitis]|uniref:Putative aliphatic sulfonates-binding protein n=1 Tax=Nocardia macrotermitis TaxID=2585198 RepID=A0A7K0CU91_9NOCA|nr:ABC transporter substrate-binding protein [Nocardia macrotermitis]MQY17039.1 putative aliphatic sulfonates-binding protein [Nocardia macrotermitis]
MTSRTLRPITVVAALLALLGSLVACTGSGDSDPKSLTVGFVVDPSWAQIPVAEQGGYFTARGVKVKVVNFATGVEALQALAAHQVDIATAADVPAAAALTRTPSLRIVADGSRWQGSRIVARRSAGITSVDDLSGKSIGTPLGTSAAYFASNALSHSNITAKLVQVAPPAAVTAATQHNVDAIAIFQPYQAQVEQSLGTDAIELAAGTYNQHSLYLATDTAVSAKPAALSAFLAALNDASTQLATRTTPAISAVATATQLPADLLTRILPEFDYTLTLPADLPEALTAQANWAKSQGAIDHSATLPNYTTFLDRAFLPHAG